jgi:hypothetical protein
MGAQVRKGRPLGTCYLFGAASQPGKGNWHLKEIDSNFNKGMCMKNKIVLALAVLALVACGKKDSDKKTDASRELVSKPELTQAQKDEIKEIISKANVIPRSDLLTDDTGSSAEAKASVEAKIKALPAEEKQVFEKLKADCKIGKVDRKETGDLKAKASKKEMTIVASISGDKCPIEHKHSSAIQSSVTEGTSGEDGTIQNSTKMEDMMTVKMQDLQTQSGLKEISITANGNGTIVVKDGKLVSMSKVEKVTMKMVTSKDQKVLAEMILEAKDSKDAFEGYIRLDFDFPSSKPTLQAFRKSGEKETEYFLNGQKISVEKLSEIFTAKSIPVIGEPTKESNAEIKRRLM